MSNKNKKSIFEIIIYNNKLLLLISFLLSIAFAIYLSVYNNPIVNRSIEVPINLSTEGTAIGDKDYVPFGLTQPSSTLVGLSGKRYIVSSVDPNDLLVTPKLNEVTEPGQYTLQLNPPTVVSGKGDYEIKSFYPQTIDVFYDREAEATLPITVSAPNISAQEGLILGDAKFTEANSSVVISGPETHVNQVDRAVAIYDEQQVISETTMLQGEIKLFDKNGNGIDPKENYLTLNTEVVDVTIPVLKEAELPIKPNFTNFPKYFEDHPELIITSVNSVLVRGETNEIVVATELALQPIDFREVTLTSSAFQAEIIYPQGVEPVDSSKTHVTVSINLNAFTTKTVGVANFKYDNIASNLTYTATPIQNVEIMCLKTTAEKAMPSDVIGKLDLQNNTTAGSFEIPVVFYSDKYTDVWGTGNISTVVTIE